MAKSPRKQRVVGSRAQVMNGSALKTQGNLRKKDLKYNKQNSIIATSGKSKYKFDITQDNFAWISSNKIEKKIVKRMKKASRIMITGYNKSGSQTIDHYSLMGFTKAYNAAKKNCS